MSELNRARIVKALECCYGEGECPLCPFYLGEDRNCYVDLGTDALSLIKELTEENERLKLAPEIGSVSVPEALEIINRYCETYIKQAQADTVRKMHHTILLEFSDCLEEETVSIGSLRSSIDQIAKEMLGRK